MEALKENLVQLEQEDVKVVTIHDAAGSITEYDVMLASASEAIVIGFNVKPEAKVQDLADQEKVEIKLYTVIYECVDDIKKAITGMMAPKLVEKTLGRAEVREIFTVPKLGAIAGSYVSGRQDAQGFPCASDPRQRDYLRGENGVPQEIQGRHQGSRQRI